MQRQQGELAVDIDEGEWDRLTCTERVELCIRKAYDAQAAANGVTGDMQEMYFRLAFAWLALANEIDVVKSR
jgi:hypothetical protein